MRKLIFIGVAAASASLLAGCGTTTVASINSTLDTLAKDYAPCDRTVNYSASVGAMNPGSGAQVQGTIHCPPHNPDGSPLPATSAAPATTTTTTTTP